MLISSFGRRRMRLALASGMLVMGLAVPAAVSADTTTGVPSIPPAWSRDATIQVTSVSVTAKVIATVTIAFTCQPFQSYDWQTGQTIETTAGRVEGGQVIVVQAQGRTIDWGEADLFGGTAACDGVTVNVLSAPVTAAVSPWKVGTAVVGASVYLVDEFGSDSDGANSGPITVRLTNR
jgi:hypothetical protein